MIQIAMVDDDVDFFQVYQKKLVVLFQDHHIACEIDTFTNTRLFLESCKEHSYHLVFLDIDMPEVSGIQLASDLRKYNEDAKLVFVSNHDNFVFETFQYNTYRFIRKNKLLDDTTEMVDSFCNLLKAKSICVYFDTDAKKNILQNLSKIMYFYSIRHDLFFCDSQGKSFRLAMHKYTMNQFEEQFSPIGFIRIHRSYLVNYRWILQIKSDFVYLNTPNYEKLPLSRGRSEQVKKMFQKFIREEGSL